jgi:hypothetical protein
MSAGVQYLCLSSTPTPEGVGVPHRNRRFQRNGHVPFIWHHHIKGTRPLSLISRVFIRGGYILDSNIKITYP